MAFKWNKVKLGQLLIKSTLLEAPIAFKTYKQTGIQLWGKGAYIRDSVDGDNTSYKLFNRLITGDFVMNKIWARNGAVTVVSREFDGSYVSTEFPVYHVNNNFMHPNWMLYVTKQKWFWDLCNEQSFGTSGKNRIKTENFLLIEIPLPSLEEQQQILTMLDKVAVHIDVIKEIRVKQQKNIQHLLSTKFREYTNSAKYYPINQIAPITRRKVDLQAENIYNELGVRSFGKGLFLKPSFKGKDLSWQQPYWMKAGDLLFSNIKAWEGAVAVIPEKYDGWVGSHRYITCKPNESLVSSEFLLFYFLSPEGLERLNLASPGSADRNRTLNTKVLSNSLIPVPTKKAQVAFLELKVKFDSILIHYQNTLKQLDELFLTLMERTFSSGLSKEFDEVKQIEKQAVQYNSRKLSPAYRNQEDYFLHLRASLDTYILIYLKKDPNLHRTKMEKITHLLEYHCVIDLLRNPIRDVAGPSDYSSRLQVESLACKAGFYTTQTTIQGNGFKEIAYILLNSSKEKIKIAEEYFGDKIDDVNILLNLVKPLSTKQSEVIATLYGSWNDFLINGKQPTDNEIIQDVRNNWDIKKKKIPQPLWDWGLNWMRVNNIIPKGRGKVVLQKLKQP